MRRFFCVLFSALCLSACVPRVELAFMAVCLGVDAGAEGITLTVKCPDYSGGDKKESAGYAVLSATGADWPRAVDALYEAAPVSPQFSQLREIMISEDSFRRVPAERLLALIDSLPGIRVHALVTVCAGSAAGTVEKLKPEIGKRLSKYLDIALRHWEEQGAIPATSLSCALRDIDGGWRDPVLAYTDGESYAGAYALGSAESLLLTPEETQLCRLLRGESQAWRLQYAGHEYGAAARGSAKREVRNGALTLRLPVWITYSLYDAAPDPGAAEALRGEAEALLRRLQAAGCDALGFGCSAVRSYATLPEWLQSGWRARFREAPLRVEVDAKTRQQPLL